MKDKFSALKLRFGMNPTASRSRSKPPFFNYMKPYMVYFKKGVFHKTSSSQYFLIGAFSGFDI